jgi:c-di-GMP phosphodiesterase
VSIIKLDVRAVRGKDLADLARRCRQFDVQLLAEKVETESELAEYLEMGFDLFQGYLLERPVVISGRTIEAGQAAQLRLAATLLGGDLDFDELDDLLHSDPGLAYQVMQIASLGRAGETRRTINSTRDALILAGSRRVQNWMAVLLARADPGATRANFTKTLVRARACELLAAKVGELQSSMGFTAGLLSALDLLLGIPVDELCESLAIGDDLAAAAFGDNTELGRMIRDAEEYQLEAPRRQRHSELSETELRDVFSQAFVWTMQATTALDL